jgi:hypothetical protein
MTAPELKQLLTPEFLETLKVAVEYCGWDVDFCESMAFCDWCYEFAGLPPQEYQEYRRLGDFGDALDW